MSDTSDQLASDVVKLEQELSTAKKKREGYLNVQSHAMVIYTLLAGLPDPIANELKNEIIEGLFPGGLNVTVMIKNGLLDDIDSSLPLHVKIVDLDLYGGANGKE